MNCVVVLGTALTVMTMALREHDGAKCLRWVDLGVALSLLLLAACGGDGGNGGSNGPPQVSTLAYVVSECREGKAGYFHRQSLRIRQGEQEPVTVAEFSAGPLPAYGVCRSIARAREGSGFDLLGVFQRLGVTPDGRLIVFEVTDEHSLVSQTQLAPEQEGIFVVRADGTGLRRLGDASHAPNFAWCWPDPHEPPRTYGGYNFTFSPDGRTFAFTDSADEDPRSDAQVDVWTQDLINDDRFHVTHLPRVENLDCGLLATFVPWFVPGSDRMRFTSYANPTTSDCPLGCNPDGDQTSFSVRTNGEELQAAPLVALPGGELIPDFRITGREPTAGTLAIPGRTPINGPGSPGNVVLEAFLFDQDYVLQLTNFQRSDTGSSRVAIDRQHVFFNAFADPLHENPAGSQQFFSVDRIGGNLRQLTHFTNPGCLATGRYEQDLLTGSVIFESNCDPFGTNPAGAELFAMHPDGTGLRQLTFLRGVTTEPDRTVTLEVVSNSVSPVRER